MKVMVDAFHGGVQVAEDGVAPVALRQLDAGLAAAGHHRWVVDGDIRDIAKKRASFFELNSQIQGRRRMR
jgi:hypothetical protein